jgi:ubiquinone/menaquinone biosynthesis C-methylase UbiE
MQDIPSFAGTVPANYEKYLGPFLFEPYALDVAARLQDKRYPSILEIACGTGRVTNHLSGSVQHDSLIATDLNPDMIEVAKKIVTNPSIRWMAADAVALPFADHSFDAVVCQFGIMFFPDKRKGLQEMYRVLKAGGKLIFNTWDKLENLPAVQLGRKVIDSFFETDPPEFYNIPFSMHDEHELRTLMLEAGFKNISISLVKKEGVSPSAANLARGMVEGSPMYVSIIERDAALVEPMKEKVEKELGEKFGNNPLTCNLQAWVCEGEK